jgi:2-iminobutanoate/2-iminopropanoate deaminase
MKNLIVLPLLIALGGCSAASPIFYGDAKTIAPYSNAVRTGSTLYVSGQLGMNPETLELVADDVESQATQVFTNLQAVLTKSGYTLQDVVQCTVYLKDIRDFKKMNDIYARYFTAGKYPARVALEVANLPKNAKIEIAAIASK